MGICCTLRLHSPVLGTELVGGGVVQQQGVAVVVQGPDGLLSPQAEAGRHGYDGGRRAVGLQPLNGRETQTVDDQQTRTVGEPQLRHTQGDRRAVALT